MFSVFSVVDGGPEPQPVTSGLSLDFCSLKHLFALPIINIFHPFAPLVIWGFWGLGALVDLNRQLSSMNEAVNYSGHGRGHGCGNERSSEKDSERIRYQQRREPDSGSLSEGKRTEVQR